LVRGISVNKLVAINIVLLAIGASNVSFGMMVKYGSIRPSFQACPTDQKWKTARHDALQLARADIRHTQIINKEKKLFDSALKVSDKFTDLTRDERQEIDEQQSEREELFRLLPPKIAMKRINEEFIIMGQRLDVAEQKELEKILNKKGLSKPDQKEYFEKFDLCKKHTMKSMKTKKNYGRVIHSDLNSHWVGAVTLAAEVNELEISSIELGIIENCEDAFGSSTIVPAWKLLAIVQTKNTILINEFIDHDFRKIVKLDPEVNQSYKKIDGTNSYAKNIREMCLQHTAFHEVTHLIRAHAFAPSGDNAAKERLADVFCALRNEKAAECGRWVGANLESAKQDKISRCKLYPGSYPYLAVAHTNWKVLNLLKAKETKRLAAFEEIMTS
jgi:hypothetical protein